VFEWQVWGERVKPGFTWSVSIFMVEVMSVFLFNLLPGDMGTAGSDHEGSH
jgi:hypothetical protein